MNLLRSVLPANKSHPTLYSHKSIKIATQHYFRIITYEQANDNHGFLFRLNNCLLILRTSMPTATHMRGPVIRLSVNVSGFKTCRLRIGIAKSCSWRMPCIPRNSHKSAGSTIISPSKASKRRKIFQLIGVGCLGVFEYCSYITRSSNANAAPLKMSGSSA